MKRAFLIGTAMVLVVLLYPRSVVTAPSWEVVARDEHGNPVSDVEVTENWNYYPFRDGESATIVTDSQGMAKFPERRMRVPLAETALGKLNGLLPHGSFGPMASVIVVKSGYSTFSAANYEKGVWVGPQAEPLRSEWTLYSCGDLVQSECNKTFFPNREARR